MIQYKNVWRSLDRLVSSHAVGQSEVIYKVGEWADAPEWLAAQGYHLLVFDTPYDAKEFCGQPCSMYEAECEEEVPLPERCDMSALAVGAIEPWHSAWPAGTRMFKRVKLLRRMNKFTLEPES